MNEQITFGRERAKILQKSVIVNMLSQDDKFVNSSYNSPSSHDSKKEYSL